MRKTIAILIFVFVFCGCSTRIRRINCTNVQRIPGIVLNVEIEKGTWSDNVTLRFGDGRSKKLVRQHDMTFILQRGRKYTIGYSGDSNVIFWITSYRERSDF